MVERGVMPTILCKWPKVDCSPPPSSSPPPSLLKSSPPKDPRKSKESSPPKDPRVSTRANLPKSPPPLPSYVLPTTWPQISHRVPCPPAAKDCHLGRSKQLAHQYLSHFKHASIPESSVSFAATMWRSTCMLVQVVNSTVYFDATWTSPYGKVKEFHHARILSVPALLKRALASGMTIPDVELITCGSDGSAPGSPTLENVAFLNGTHPPALTPLTVPSRAFDAVPVPMVSRGWDTDGYHWLGSALWDGTRLANQSSGNITEAMSHERHERWSKKVSKALFRGNIWMSQNQAVCEQNFAKSVITFDQRRTVEPGSCYRQAVVDRLQGLPQVDARYDNFLPEAEWSRYRLLLIIGGNLGWSDRFKACLFKDQVSVLVDCGTHEWWYPLLTEGVHYFRANTSVASINKTVHQALLLTDDKLFAIAQAAAHYATEIFEIGNVAAYMAYVAIGVSKKLKYTPRVRQGFEEFMKTPRKLPHSIPWGFKATATITAEQVRDRIARWLVVHDRNASLQALTDNEEGNAHVLATQVANEMFPPKY